MGWRVSVLTSAGGREVDGRASEDQRQQCIRSSKPHTSSTMRHTQHTHKAVLCVTLPLHPLRALHIAHARRIRAPPPGAMTPTLFPWSLGSVPGACKAQNGCAQTHTHKEGQLLLSQSRRAASSCCGQQAFRPAEGGLTPVCEELVGHLRRPSQLGGTSQAQQQQVQDEAIVLRADAMCACDHACARACVCARVCVCTHKRFFRKVFQAGGLVW